MLRWRGRGEVIYYLNACAAQRWAALYIAWLSDLQRCGVQWIVKEFSEVTGGHIGPVDPHWVL
jgi:hypothetical protein